MSLLDSFYKKYNIMNETTMDDPEGGWVTGWTPGATVEMALDDPSQAQRLIAQAQRLSVTYPVLFPIGTPVRLNSYLRSVEDESLVYLVQTKPVEAPGPSGIRVIKAEVIETRLPV